MALVFADTVYWVARINPLDKHHHEAGHAFGRLTNPVLVTTDSVFGEVLALLSGKRTLRPGAVSLFRSVDSNPNVHLVRQHAGLFDRALERYRLQQDATASLVDCLSMEVMDDFGISEVLTADGDFEEAGYTRLMRNPNEL